MIWTAKNLYGVEYILSHEMVLELRKIFKQFVDVFNLM